MDSGDKKKPNPMRHSFGITERVETATCGAMSLTLVDWKGQPVVFARELGRALDYAAEGRGLVQLLADEWADEVEEGIDTLKITNGELAALKAELNQAGIVGLVDPQAPSVLLLTEAGLDLVLIKTEKPVGKAMRKWLRREVLPKWRAQHAAPPPPPQKPPRQLGGPLPVPKGMPKEEAEVNEAKHRGLEAYEALDPAVRRRGEIAGMLRGMQVGQARWLCGQLSERSGLVPPEFHYGGKECPEYGPIFEARAQVWWMVQRMTDLAEVQKLVVEALDRRENSTQDATRKAVLAKVNANLQKLRDSTLSWLADVLALEGPDLDRALKLLQELGRRGPKAVRQAEEWCERLWQLESR